MTNRLKKRESEIGWKLNSDSSPFAEGHREVETWEEIWNVDCLYEHSRGACPRLYQCGGSCEGEQVQEDASQAWCGVSVVEALEGGMSNEYGS